MKKCARCDYEYDDAYDGCPQCARADSSAPATVPSHEPASSTPYADAAEAAYAPLQRRRFAKLAVALGIAVCAVAAVAIYYSQFSHAVSAAHRIPQDAPESDATKLIGRKRGFSKDTGDVRVSYYQFSDYSILKCTFVGVKETRTRKTLKIVPVTTTKRVWKQVGWNYYLGMSEYDWVNESVTKNELQSVDEQYTETVWKFRSAMVRADYTRVRTQLGF